MSKLARPVFCILFVLVLGSYSFGQVRVRVRVPVRRGYPLNRPMNQRPGSKMEQVRESFISKQLKLTPQESAAFWPLYREETQKLTAVRILKRLNNSDRSVDGTEQIRRDLDYDAQLVAIRKQYSNEFLRILPPEKVSELYKSERQFNDEALRILSEKSIRAGD